MSQRALAVGLVAMFAACSGSAPGELSDASDPAQAGPSSDASAAADGNVPGGNGDVDVDSGPPPPLVRLAPALDTKLDCNNAELPFDFDPATREFNLDHAFWMMWFAERTLFSEQPDVASELSAIGFDQFAHFEDTTGLQLYVAGSAKSVIVAFRGSSELKDWLGNFNFPQDEGTDHGVTGRVHRGFASALSPTFQTIAETIERFASAGQPVWITGHSLGGAEATLTAARLALGGTTKLAPLYTFGAPRAGDYTFARDVHERLAQRVYRVVNELDIVPRLPPTANAAEESANVLPLLQDQGAQTVRDLDYRHPGQMAWLELAAGPDLTLLPSLNDDEDEPYWAEAGKNGTFGAIAFNQQQSARHAPQRYLCRMYALRQASAKDRGPKPDRKREEERAREENWALRETRAIESWQLVRARGREPGEGVLIAHPDTGTSEHPELSDHPTGRSPIVWSLGYDFVDGDRDPRHDFSALNRLPAHGHGSETSSVMVSPLACPRDTAEPCVTGASPAAKLIPLRVSEAVVLVTGDKVAEGVTHAIEVGAHVIAISMGGVTPMPKLEAAIADALEAGIIVVSAAGNNVVVVNPCTIEGVVCVAGVTPALKPWSGSSFGSRVDISAPATEVRYARTTHDQGKHVYEVGLAMGTSDATALTASAAAIWLSYHGRDALLARYGAAGIAPTFRRLIKERAFNVPTDWPSDGSFGAGILDMVKLLEAPLP